MIAHAMPDLFATTAKGMEPLLAGELRALGATAVEERRAGCAFEGTLALAYRACLWSRTANRVLLPIARFTVEDQESLYAGVRAIAWGEHLSARETLAVDFTISGEATISHTHFGALKTKDAIVDRLRDESGARPSIDRTTPDVLVNLHLDGSAAVLSIDLVGRSLHRRGWREPGAPAPLKENLAAAILLYAGWPERALAGQPLIDPMCGSGTIPIEAAQIALDIAPGLAALAPQNAPAPNRRSDRFSPGRSTIRSLYQNAAPQIKAIEALKGPSGWYGHDLAAWSAAVAEARDRERAAADRAITILGFDADDRAVRAARDNAARAGLGDRLRFEVRALDALVPPDGAAPGVVIANPPYGERLGDADELAPLYQSFGDILRRKFPSWTGFLFTGNLDLAQKVGLRPAHRHVLHNGAIECRLLEYPISATPVTGDAGPSWRRPRAPDPAVEMFKNRLAKNLKHLRKWARREHVDCYRVYDADLPEYAVAVDLYQDALHVQEYAPPKTIDPERAAHRLEDLVASLPEVTGVAAESVFLKVRRRQRPVDQYGKFDESGAERAVREGGYEFLVNLRDFLDTGLFLDHRKLRALIGELARDRRFLNLFAYTSTATVYAARGGASSTTSVDLSNTYLDWSRRNFARNQVGGRAHALEREDVMAWLARDRTRYGLIFCAPPTFSNSKRMEGTFDVQRDHVALLRACVEHLEPGGVLLFSNHLRRFKMDTEALTEALGELTVENITPRTLPEDFSRNPRIHNSWRITR